VETAVREVRTDFITGDFANDIGWKLNGFFPSGPPFAPLPSDEKEPYRELGLAGLRGPEEAFGGLVPYRLAEKFSLMGAKEHGS